MKKILILSANPKSTNKLRLDEEVREIQVALERAKHREQFEIITRWAVRVDDLRRALLDQEPQIIHFSGHGTGSQGLVLENDSGQSQLVSTAALARLFKLFKNTIECVFFNACYSEVQAEVIHQHIDYVVGMNQAIGDRAAIKFVIGFYDALGAGRSFEDAFELGCTGIDLEGIPESSTPVFKVKPRLSSSDGEHNDVDCQEVEIEMKLEEWVSLIPLAQRVRVFISYRSQDPDKNLAEQFYKTLKAAGHEVFTVAECIRLGETWVQRINTELEKCDYFLLLLSEKSAVSEIVTEEVLRVKQLQETRANNRPAILPIRVNFPIDSHLNYNLRGYLQHIQQCEWKSPIDTPKILREILSMLSLGEVPVAEELSKTQLPAIETPNQPPLPVAEPELPEGQIELASQFYVQRPPIESRCYEEIERPGSLIRIKAPRQMGKTSLMARILHHAAESKDCLKVQLSFQLADGKIFTDLDQFLRWFCSSVGRRLKLPNRLTDFWDEVFGSKDNCTAYFEEYLLASVNKPLVLGLDEIDLVFQHQEIASDFFGLLRAWHEEAKSRKIWKRLRLVIVHSTEIYIPLNINQSPFNVGLPIELPEFTLEQLIELAQRHGLNWNAVQAKQLMSMVGGHPYLVRVGLYSISRQDMTLNQLLQIAPTEAGPYGDHLRRHLWNLEQRPELLEAVKRVISTTSPVRLESVQAFQLHSLGLMHLQGNDVIPRCNLYREYFQERLRVR
ncbi:MAG: AAA-like domain-containing protein [Rhizonema sp. PD38]|nr:AAA-like domain-containing protein [Rhizonema sp. PD38]